MTRRHFEALANSIRASLDIAESDTARYTIKGLAERIAGICKGENQRFDCGRFMRACGLSLMVVLTLATTARHHSGGGHSHGGHSHYSQA